jgi:hypothetical protein
MQPGNALMSSISVDSLGVLKAWLMEGDDAISPVKTVSALTCVAAPVPTDAFRPSYCDRTHQKFHCADSLRRDLLPRLAKVSGIPDINTWAGHFRRPWLDVCFFGFDAAVEYQPHYAREIGRATGIAALLLECDFTLAEKESLLIYFVQYGIDLWGIAQAGYPGWPAHGGHGSGRKLPIIFAGIMLGDTAMANPNASMPNLRFGEDMQTAYGPCWSSPLNVVYAGHQGVWNGQTVNTSLGWGPYEHLPPSQWYDNMNESYRRCCTSIAWVGQAMAIRILKVQDKWNHPAFFDYIDRWMNEDDSISVATILAQRGWDYSAHYGRQKQCWDSFVENLYAKYRFLPLDPPRQLAFQATEHSITLSWTAPDITDTTDQPDQYIIKKGAAIIATVTTNTFTENNLPAATAYLYTVTSADKYGNQSKTAAQINAATAADLTKPAIDSVFTASLTSVVVVFNEPITRASAEAAGNYQIASGVTVTGAALEQNGFTVLLTTSAHTANQEYILTVNGVQDPSGNAVTNAETMYTAYEGFFDDFESGTLSKWVPSSSAAWQVADGNGGKVLYRSNGSGEKLFASNIDFTTLAFTGQVRGQGASAYRNLCVVFGYQDTSHYYYAMFAGVNTTAYNGIFKVLGDSTQKIGGVTAGATLTDTTTYHAVKVLRDIATGSIKVYFDNNLVFSAFDWSYTSGKVALWSKSRTGYFDNVDINRYIEVGISQQRMNVVSVPGKAFFLSAVPNPFVYTITINLKQIPDSPSELGIYAFNGKKVCSLAINLRAKATVWDGRDAGGKEVKDGVYYIRYGQYVEKIVLLR